MKKSEIVQRLEAIEKHIGIATEETKLEVGTWYKYPNIQNWKIQITEIHTYSVSAHGFNCAMDWMVDGKWEFESDHLHKLVKCTPKEIETSLEIEAKTRYKVGDQVKCLLSNMCAELTGCPYVYSSSHVHAKTNCLASGYIQLYHNGKWAEIIEVDKFAELKEAYKNGAVIQRHRTHAWVDDFSPSWESYHEYRIKPEEKPKVGDVVKAWCRNEEHYVVGNLTDISTVTENKYGVHILGVSALRNTIYYANAKPLTKQEAIKLLFGDE